MEQKRIKVGIVGGGAAGMMAAIAAADSGAEVTILEGGDRVGRKLLSTGNGKCNLGNMHLNANCYYGSTREWIGSCLERFDTEATVDFFGRRGLLLKDKGGYLYPLGEQAAIVLDVLRTQLHVSGVRVITGCRVDRIAQESNGFALWSGERTYHFDRVILSCGGKAAPKTGSDGSGYRLAGQMGHTLIPVVPALVQLKCREDHLKAVTGVRCDAVVKVYHKGKEVSAERGELQLADYGISGIVVFQMSRIVNYILRREQEVEVICDLLPDYDVVSYEEMKKQREPLKKGRTVEEFFTGVLNKKLMQLFIRLSGLKNQEPAEYADPVKLEHVYALCRDWRLHVNGSKSFENAQVCAGGVDTGEITENMESVLHRGLYFAGELLDVDGRCGGYNLQWAWCSGYLAGKAAADCRREQSAE